jgi:Protein of unknown function (DUF1587)
VPNGVDPTQVAPNANAPFGAAPASLKRLRAVEYQNSIKDLLGAQVSVPAELETDLARGGFTTISAAIDPYSSTGIEHFETAAYDLAGQVFQSPDSAAALVGCRPTTADDACVGAFLRSFGRRVFRRPLADAEAAAWAKVVSEVTASAAAIERDSSSTWTRFGASSGDSSTWRARCQPRHPRIFRP